MHLTNIPHIVHVGKKSPALGTKFLRFLPAEFAHTVGLKFLDLAPKTPGLTAFLPPILHTNTFQGFNLQTNLSGIGRLHHPIGLAAGFDKNIAAPHGFAKLGFAFLEMGTVTPRPQPGNPKPRLFRLKDQNAIVNRMGFNNKGALHAAQTLAKTHWRHDIVPLGLNVGKNKDTPVNSAVDDYCQVVELFLTGPTSQNRPAYFTVNISSPNTPGLRELATPEFIQLLAEQLGERRRRVWIKLDPDMAKKDFQKVVETTAAQDFQGLILSNTHRVETPEKGGLSGPPLISAANASLERAWEVHRGTIPMIGVGGVSCGLDVFEKMARGASAVQIYSALVYRGPWAVHLMLEELVAEMQLRGIKSVEDIIGSHYI